MSSYALVTAARNEEKYIETTIRSVAAQTARPARWIVVSDGSTDRTDEIVRSYAEKSAFMELLRLPSEGKRNFGAKARAVALGYARLGGVGFDYFGNLDADVGFEPSYYESVMRKFEEDPGLGVCGGVRYDLCDGKFERVHCASNSVGGPFQMFRRKCYDDIGGYRALEYGGIDAVAETMARMHGWRVRSFPELEARHYRCTGSASAGAWRARFRAGVKDYLLGYHPLFYFLKTAAIQYRPLVVGGALQMMGYGWAAARGMERPVPDSFVRYLRFEQIDRMRSALSWRAKFASPPLTGRAAPPDRPGSVAA